MALHLQEKEHGYIQNRSFGFESVHSGSGPEQMSHLSRCSAFCNNELEEIWALKDYDECKGFFFFKFAEKRA